MLSLPTPLTFKKLRQRVGRGFHETDSIVALLVLVGNEVTEGEVVYGLRFVVHDGRVPITGCGDRLSVCQLSFQLSSVFQVAIPSFQAVTVDSMAIDTSLFFL